MSRRIGIIFLVTAGLLLVGCGTRRSSRTLETSPAPMQHLQASLNVPRLNDRASLYLFNVRTFERNNPPMTVQINDRTLGTLQDNQYFRLALKPDTYHVKFAFCPGAYRCTGRRLRVRKNRAYYFGVRRVNDWSAAILPLMAVFGTVGQYELYRVTPSKGRDWARDNRMMMPQYFSFSPTMVD